MEGAKGCVMSVQDERLEGAKGDESRAGIVELCGWRGSVERKSLVSPGAKRERPTGEGCDEQKCTWYRGESRSRWVQRGEVEEEAGKGDSWEQ